jgi:hypothetical protein
MIIKSLSQECHVTLALTAAYLSVVNSMNFDSSSSHQQPQDNYHNKHLYQANSTPYTMGSVVLPHLVSGWHVDQAIMSEEERLVIIRFGRDWDPDCMRQDEVLYRKPLFHPLQ